MKRAYLADLLDFTAAPAWGERDPLAVRWRPAHWLLVDESGRIVAVQPEAPGPDWVHDRQPGRLLLPGFIDCHVHSPQIGVLGSWGSELLDWLNTYTFPAETAWSDPAVAARGTAHFLDALLAHGTTSAAVFPTVHAHSAAALFEGAAARGMRMIAGKVLMDRHCPPGLSDDPADVARAERDCVDLIDRHHGRDRNAYAVTVRFAPTSTPAQLAMAGALCRADPTLYMQTHVAENRAEGRWVAELFGDARSYLDVYDRVGLVHPRALLAHGIWLDDTDRAVLRERGAAVAHCPSSNLFLGSGLLDWPRLQRQGVAVGLASDVGGGTSLSMLRTLAAAYQVQALRAGLAEATEPRLTAWVALDAATRGAAAALQLGHEIGRLEPGLMADFTLWDWQATEVDRERQRLARDLHERVFAWLTLADERHLVGTWVGGQPRYARTP
jgi:guanine deaminase